MKEYHKILYYTKGIMEAPVIAFNKLDGSNIRAEYSKKKGFHKFGTRRRLLDPDEKPFGKAIPLIMRLEDQVSDILKKQRIDRATLFFEFYGDTITPSDDNISNLLRALEFLWSSQQIVFIAGFQASTGSAYVLSGQSGIYLLDGQL